MSDLWKDLGLNQEAEQDTTKSEEVVEEAQDQKVEEQEENNDSSEEQRSLNNENEDDSQESESSEEQAEDNESESTSQEEQVESEEDGLTGEEFLGYVSENVDYLIENLDDQTKEALLKSLGGSTESQFANEEAKSFNEFAAKTGRSLEDYMFIQSFDTESMNPEEAIKLQLKLDNPSLDNEDIHNLFESKYKLDEDEYSEKEVRVSKSLLKADGIKAKQSLADLKSEWQKPQPKAQDQPQEAPSLYQENFDVELKDSFEGIESLVFDLDSKGTEFEFKINEGQGEKLFQSNFNPNDPLARYRDSNGKVDSNRFAEEMTLLDNIDVIVKSAYQQGASSALEKSVRDKKNIDLNQQNRPATPESNKSSQKEKVMNWFK